MRHVIDIQTKCRVVADVVLHPVPGFFAAIADQNLRQKYIRTSLEDCNEILLDSFEHDIYLHYRHRVRRASYTIHEIQWLARQHESPAVLFYACSTQFF
jgi:hypothetical protein